MYSVDTTVSNKNEISVPDLISFPDWSPDGQWLVYSKYGNIFKRNIADNIEIQLTFFGGNRFPSWSNDGVWIAFHSNKDSPNGMSFIWKMKSDGSELKRIIYTPEDGEVKHPDWFPDGIRLVVIRSLCRCWCSKKFALQNLNLSAQLKQTFWPPTTVPAKSATALNRIIISYLHIIF